MRGITGNRSDSEGLHKSFLSRVGKDVRDGIH